ncbi:pyruvate kinase-like [Condylostylus longicornis]|uniref:pyruvate kinase-like n=1 Tax=Condylostylus longicornis TaxID=2530218 RepID=UPI00244DD379|nr:pyruvate kinase-like [Condylostylus longicornis]
MSTGETWDFGGSAQKRFDLNSSSTQPSSSLQSIIQMNRMVSSSHVLSKNLGKTTDIRMNQILENRNDDEYLGRRTKIVCTMGPSCWDVENLEKLIDAGMNVARLNFSHGDHAAHAKTVANLHEAMRRRNKKVGILLDTKGPEIRTGMLKDHASINLVLGQTLKVTTDYDFLGDSNCISCSYPALPQSVKVGGKILMADGTITLEVMSIGDDHVMTKVLNNATMGERKNMNLPNVKVDLPVCGEREKNDILSFGIPQGCNFIAASFTQTAEDVRYIREVLGARGRHIKIIPKIENVEGILNFDEILAEADGIMVARGDMGMEIPPEKVFLAQKMMIAKCNIAGKPVITATQMLESMIKNPRPTRAEVADVANAVLDGTDCVMLSGETAGGAFPIEAVRVMAKTCLEAEACIDYPALYNAIHSSVPRPVSVQEAVCCAAVETAEDIKASLIISLTETGLTAKLIAKYRPYQVVLALSASESTIRHLQMHRGVVCIQVPSFQGTDSVIKSALIEAKDAGLVSSGETVVCVHGIQEEVAGGTNLMKVVVVP